MLPWPIQVHKPRTFPLKLPLLMGDLESGPSSNTLFPGLTRVFNPNSISIGSAYFAGLTRVTDRQTDKQTTLRSVTIGRIYVRSAAIRPNNNVITLHRSTTAAYCQSVSLSVTLVSPAKTAEPMVMPFGLWTRVGPRMHKFNRIRQVETMCLTALCRELCKQELSSS